MPTGSTVAQVRLMVKAEIGDSVASGVNAQTDAIIDRRIVQMQQWLANEHKWPLFLRGSFDVTVPSGSRYLNYPNPGYVAMNSVQVFTKYNLIWSPVEYGIGPREYNIYDSERGVLADPISRWFEYNGSPPNTTTVNPQFEVWPMPRTPQTIRFIGQRGLRVVPSATTITGTEILDLDDMMIAFYVGAQMTVGTPLGAILQQKAQARFNQLRAQSMSESPVFALGTVVKPVIQRETTVTIRN